MTIRKYSNGTISYAQTPDLTIHPLRMSTSGSFEKPSSDRNLSVIKAKADALPYTVMNLVGPRKREVMSCWRRDRNAFH